jgi:hypothetical protein
LSRVRAPSPTPLAGVVELVDTLDLGSSASRRESSSLSFRTILKSFDYHKVVLLGLLQFFIFM